MKQIILHLILLSTILFVVITGLPDDDINTGVNVNEGGTNDMPPPVDETVDEAEAPSSVNASGRGMRVFKKPKGYMSGLLHVVTGTVFSAVNAIGQEVNNVAGDTLLGHVGNTLSQIAERAAGTIKFNLFTPKNPKEGYVLTIDTAVGSPWDKTQDTIAIIHGFTPVGYFQKSEDNIISSLRVKDGLLEDAKLKHNIIVVDWTALSSDGNYLFSSTSTSTTADRLSSLLVWLTQNGYIRGPEGIRIIGHSLGGHTAGITGKKYFEKYKLGKVARIDAIDPAGPNFDHIPSNFQLKPENGEFVHVMHCNIGFLGSKFNRGTIDFYPNGGDNLPGCEKEVAPGQEGEDSTSRKKRGAVGKHICSHVRCIDLYIELLLDEKFGCPCTSYEDFNADKCDCKVADPPRMGYYCPETASGVYYLNITMRTTYEKPVGANLTALEQMTLPPPGVALPEDTTPTPEV